VTELIEALNEANGRWDEEQESFRQTQQVHFEEERRMAEEIQELAAITEHLR
jgi:hypothetical protein